MAADAEGQTQVQRQIGPIDQFLRLKAPCKRHSYVPQTVLRSVLSADNARESWFKRLQAPSFMAKNSVACQRLANPQVKPAVSAAS